MAKSGLWVGMSTEQPHTPTHMGIGKVVMWGMVISAAITLS